jgi:hypothetical protein
MLPDGCPVGAGDHQEFQEPFMSTKPTPALMPWRRTDLIACLACMTLGLVLAIAPQLAKLATQGTLEYLPDGDDVLYLSISRIPHLGEWSTRDPFSLAEAKVPTLYSWFQFVPLAKLARLLGMSPLETGFLWRALGGPLLGGSLYVLFRKLLAGTRRPTPWAVGCTLICLADVGFVSVPPFRDTFRLLWELVDRSQPVIGANRIGQYRVVTPLLNLPFLLLLIAVLLPGGKKDWRAWLVGSICLGLCFQLYFFFWTAALVGIGGYLAVRGLRLLVTRAGLEEWADVRFGAVVLAGGMVLGAPQVYSNARTFADPAYRPTLDRMQRGRHLEPGDPQRTIYVKNKWPWLELTVGAAVIVGFGFWNVGLVWWMLLAGFLLNASAAVTGLEFENFHWLYVWAPAGEIMLLALACLLLDRLQPARWKVALWALPAVLVLIALVWKPYEALYQRHSVEYGQLLRDLKPLRPALAELSREETLAGPIQVNAALIMTPAGLLYQFDQTWMSSPIPTSEVNQRFALNAWLLGMDMPRFVEAIKDREPVQKFRAGDEWVKTFQSVLDGGAEDLLRRFRIGALLLPADAPEPVRGGPWRLAARGENWTLWRRDPAPSINSGAR